MNDRPTLGQVEHALDELESLMAECDNHDQLELFSALYAKAYGLKLSLMAKEVKDVGH